MKALPAHTVVLVALAVASRTLGQIPNPGFEDWSGSTPSGWVTNNIPFVATPLTKSLSAHSGAAAVQGTVVPVLAFGGIPDIPFLWSGFPYSQRPGRLQGFYMFTPLGGDSLTVIVTMLQQQSVIGLASFSTGATVGSYTQFTIPIEYLVSENPDSCIIRFLIRGSVVPNDTPHIGSTYLLDDLSFTGAAGVKTEEATLSNFSLLQNYPNPLNPNTVIGYRVSGAGFVSLKVYDILGREVATLVNEVKEPGTYTVQFDGSNLASGVYFYQLKSGPDRIGAGTFVQTKRLLLLR